MLDIAQIVVPVFVVILVAYAVARAGCIDAKGVSSLSRITFDILVPCMLFRTMTRVDLAGLDLRPAGVYFLGAVLLFVLALIVLLRTRGFSSAVVAALCMSFSNTVMLGIPLVKLIYGESGLVILLTLISGHSLVMLTTATVLLEAGEARRAQTRGSAGQTIWRVIKNTVIHPVVLPIIIGLLWAALLPPLPATVDSTLKLIGDGTVLLCLLVLGGSLAQFSIVEHWRAAARYTLVKNLALPVIVYLLARYAFVLPNAAIKVITFTAALPIGINVYLFAERYNSNRAEATAGITLSTVVAVLTLSLVLALIELLAGR